MTDVDAIVNSFEGYYPATKYEPLQPLEMKAYDNPEWLNVGDSVQKVGGDYTFEGVIVAVFPKLSGAMRYVVEDDRGVLHVYSRKNLERR